MALLMRGIQMLQFAAIVLFLVITTGHAARAHIEIISPNGGEILVGDDLHVIEWEILESHAFLSWDIWYSENGLTGPWIPIAAGLPPGDVSLGAVHTFNWTVPFVSTFNGRIWVRATTASFTDDAFSDNDFNMIDHIDCVIEIAGDVNVSGALTSADVIFLVGYVFKSGDVPLPCSANGDVNCDGGVSAADILYLVKHTFGGGPPPCDICIFSEIECVP